VKSYNYEEYAIACVDTVGCGGDGTLADRGEEGCGIPGSLHGNNWHCRRGSERRSISDHTPV